MNKFPDFVRYIVQRLKTLNPSMGKVKIAETLCRAGLHLGTTTVGRILKEAPRSDPGGPAPCTSVVTAKRPNHIWHIDLTAIPTSVGFWAPWLPFALPQCWPFCWWVAVVLDRYSRHVVGVATFKNSPTCRSIQKFLEHTMKDAGAHPKYIISDKGQQFWCDLFKDWCERQGINPRFGAVGQHGSIALIERFMLTLKNECMLIILVPLRTDAFQQELSCFSHWYNHCRPTRRSMPGHRKKSIMMCFPLRVSVRATNRARNGRAVRHAHRRARRSLATVALTFALMCAIIKVGSTCRSLR